MIAHPIQPDLQCAVMSTYDEDGFPSIGIDGDADGVNLQPPEALHPLGVIARPKDPEADPDGKAIDGSGACTVLRLSEGNTDHVIALSDPRCTPALPRIPKGSAMVYAPSGSDDPPHVLLRGDDEHLIVHVPSTASITLEVEGGPQVVVDNGKVSLGVVGGPPVMLDNGFTAWLGSLVSALTGAGIAVPAPPTVAATKVTGI